MDTVNEKPGKVCKVSGISGHREHGSKNRGIRQSSSSNKALQRPGTMMW